MGTNGKKIAYLFLIITTSAWESLYAAGKFVLKSIPPITVLFFRYLIASILGAYIIISRVGGCGAILGAVLIVMSILFSIFGNCIRIFFKKNRTYCKIYVWR